MAASSDSEDESFVELGKPLPFIEGQGKVKPITLQDASSKRSGQDGKGRPRFHGAFTGGFSAGYFNSVGSKEGWTPSLFVSSRQQKQGAATHLPEDFMDDEDLGEHGIAPRQFATSDTFSSDALNRKRRAEVVSSTRDSILPASATLTDLILPESVCMFVALTDLIVPKRLPIGIKLLRKMGWKEGQGVGPRVKKKTKKRKGKKAPGMKIYGCSLPTQSDEEESDLSDVDLQNVTFAPKDVTPISLTSKDNVHGLGYHGLDPRSALPTTHVSLFEAPAISSAKSKKGIRGQAFGVGALENEDADIYNTDSISNYDQTMELDDSEQFFGWTAPGAHKGKGKKDPPKVPVSYVGKLLEGFTLSDKPLPPKKVFRAPTLPKGFKPFHRFKKTAQQLAQEAIGETPVTAGRQSGQQKMNAVERGLMLGETPVASSVFDLIPKEDINKMEAIKEAAKMAAASRFHSAGSTSENTDIPTPPATQADQGTPLQEKEKPSAAGGDKGDQTSLLSGGPGVRPFHKEPAKQARYDQYLTLVKQGVNEPYKDVAMGHMTEWERQREKEEFSKAIMIYRPLSNMMASRFTRGAFIDDAEHQTSGLVEAQTEKNEQAKAAEMKMYGKLTREEMEWHPHNLLCKRFNVPNPYPESDIVGVPGLKRDKFSIFTFLSVPPEPSTAGRDGDAKQDVPKATKVTNSLTRELNASKRKKGALSIFSVLEEESTPRKPLPILSASENADSANDADENGSEEKVDEDNADDDRPIDLFRAIFKNSDSESSSSSEKSDSDKSDDDEDAPAPDVEKEEKGKDSLSSADPVVSSLEGKDSKSKQPSHQLGGSQPSSNQQPSPSDSRLPPATPPGSPPPLPPPPTTAPTPITQPPRPRKASRWEVGSIFDVLDKSPPRTSVSTQQEMEGEGREERLSSPVPSSGDVEMYGPVLPPPRLTGASSSSTAVSVDLSFPTGTTHHKHKHKHKDQERDSSKHRHKKEKKKKSKHKKEKKKKKKSKRSHHKKHSSGSEADSETDSDA
ncbi:hypothetical protein ACOMHN_011047 [Nucella lapillus]